VRFLAALLSLALTSAKPAPSPPAAEAALAAQLEPYFLAGPFHAPAARFTARDWAGAADGFARVLAGHKRKSTEALRARYLQGLALANLSRFAEAATVFAALAGEAPDDPLAAYVAYNAARTYLRAGDARSALVWADRVPATSIPAAEAALIALDALTGLGRVAEIDTRAARFLDTFPAGPRRHEATFARANALEKLGRPAEAAPLYRTVWAESPAESFRTRANARLDALAAGVTVSPDLFIKTAANWVARGMVLFNANQNEAAEAAFTSALAAPGLSPALGCQAQFHRAQSVMKARQRGRADPLFSEAETACRAAGDDDFTARAIYQRGRCLINVGDQQAASAAFAALETGFPTHRLADDACLRGAEAATERGDLAAADALLAALPTRYPQGDMVGEALFRRAFRAFSEGRFADARALFAENQRLVPRASVWYAEGRAEYWQGRSLEEGEPGKRDLLGAVAAYEQAIRRYPLSYYAWLAFERLEQVAPRKRQSLLRELRPQTLPKQPALGRLPAQDLTLAEDPAFVRALELARLGQAGDAHRELARLAASRASAGPEALADLAWVSALVLHRGGLWNATYAYAADRLGDFRRSYPAGDGLGRWQVAYPRAYAPLVERESRANGVPPALQLALMREESAFDARAESTANCIGLCMLKPTTAQERLQRAVTREMLWDPATNLSAGSKHLAWLLQRADGNAVFAVAAYNAGTGSVARWRASATEQGIRSTGVAPAGAAPDGTTNAPARASAPLDMFVETIPYDETRNYTKRVLASYFVYSWLYDDAQPIPRALPAPTR
jgi:soluble lytic murein transglycosylase